jgi:hypothetical protein
MASFSERYGYTKPSEVLIREHITPEIQNAICNCYDRLKNRFFISGLHRGENPYIDMEQYTWTYFLNLRESEFGDEMNYHTVAISLINDKSNPWYEKIKLIEFTIKYLYSFCKNNISYNSIFDDFISDLNSEFKRLNFAYRIIDNIVIEVTSEEEITTIQETLQNKNGTIKMHIDDALKLCSPSKPDYRNSIKESISAVEVFCKAKTDKDTLGDALKNLEKSDIIIPQTLKNAFIKLYAYTNDPKVGIRHALMNDDTYTPKAEEAIFMLVACSAFINYLTKKESDK